MKWQQVRTFIAVYQHRSFTAAAHAVHATQSGLSMRIRELEETLGVTLFERSARGVAPTVAGERFYRHALKLMQDLDEARQDLEALKGLVAGSVSVGLMPTFARAALSPALREFSHAFPLVNVRVIEAYSAVLTERVAREELDFAIVPPPGPDARLAVRHLARDRELLVTASKGSRRPHLSPVALGDLGPLRLILPARGNARRTSIDDYLKTVGATVDRILEMDAMMATLELVATSDWVSILPGTLCHPDIPGGPRRVHPIARPSLHVDYVLVTPAAASVPAAALEFAEMLVRQVRAIGQDWERRLKGA